MSNKKITYKFSIKNLVLVNEVYPFDFFLRIRSTNSQQFQDSPIIEANQMQCDEAFPWQFAVSEVLLRIQFVQITKNTRVQILRAQFNIDSVTDEDGETVAMLANRTAKKLCLVTYKLQPYTVLRNNSENQKRSTGMKQENKKKNIESIRNQIPEQSQERQQSELKNHPAKKKPERIIFSKQQHEQLSRQIAKINKSIDKILDNQKSEHALFNKYLDQSTSFIKEMLSQSKARNADSYNQKNNKDEQRQNDSQNNEQENRPGNLDNILKQIEEQSQEKSQLFEGKQSNATQSNRQLTSRDWYKNKFKKQKPLIQKNINYRKQPTVNMPYVIPQCQVLYSKDSAPSNPSDQSSLIISDIIVNSQIVPNLIKFYDPETNKQVLIMKSKNGPGYQWKKPIQLPNKQCFIVTTMNSLQKVQLIGYIAKKQFDTQRVSLYSKTGQEKGFIRFKYKLVNAFSVQTQELLNAPVQTNQNNDLENKQPKNQQLKKNIQKNKDKPDQLRISQAYQSSRLNQRQQQKQNDQSKLESKKSDQSQKAQRRYQLSRKSSSRNSRIRKLSADISKNQNKRNQKNQMQNKQDSRSPNNESRRFNLVSNSISVAYLPLMKKQPTSENSMHHKSIYQSDQQLSDLNSSNFISRLRTVNFKIDSISAKLNNNTDHFLGKYIQLSMRNKSPFTTQIINLSQNLNWKCKGCIFDSVSPYGQLLVQLFSDDNNKPKLIGKAKICLALLNMQKSNKIQFYHQYIRDRTDDQIGQLVLGYQNVQKNKRSQSSNKIQDEKINNQGQKQKDEFGQNQATQRVNKVGKKKSRTKSKKKTDQSQVTNRTQKKQAPQIGTEGSQAKIVGSSSAIRAKKYTGGNIIIGRAARFKLDPKQQPGPGQYQTPSQFQRHGVD